MSNYYAHCFNIVDFVVIPSYIELPWCLTFIFYQKYFYDKMDLKLFYFHVTNYRSSRPEVFCRKGLLRNFATFTGKHLCQSLFFNKVAGLRPATLSKKRLWHRCFPVNVAKFLRTPFFTEHLRWLPLELHFVILLDSPDLSNLIGIGK